MEILLTVPDSVVQGLRVPEAEAEQRLRLELALSVYAQQLLSFGKAVELAGISREEFGEIVGRRGIARHYGEQELAEDLAYGRG